MSESGSVPAGERPSEPETPESSAPSADAGGPSRGATPPGAKDPLRSSRASGIWAAVVALVVLLILLSVFILQNTRTVEISYFGWDGEAPLAAMLLIAVAAGLLIAVIAGSLRILQLRRRVRHEQKR